MDIAPKPPATPNLNGATPSSPESTKAATIEALNLKPGQTYEARVHQKIAPQASAQEGKGQASPSGEWLVSLNGKLLKISSTQALELGQTLQLKLTSTNQTPSLTVISASQASTNTPSHPATNINETLSALSQLLPKQLTLEKGFTLINEVQQAVLKLRQHIPSNSSTNVKTPDSSNQAPAPNNQNSISKTLELLSNTLIKSNDVVAATQVKSSMQSATLIKQALNSSGLFMESQLSKGDNLKQFAQQLSRLTNSHQTSNTSPPSNLIPPLTPNAGNHQPTSSVNATPANKQALELIQQLVQQNSTTTSSKAGDKATLFGVEDINDIKAKLLALSSALLSSHNSSKEPKLNFDSLLAGVLQPELLNTPFNFPQISPDSAAKAKAIFADQEITTGQLLKLLAGMLNRIQFNQLNSLYQSQGGEGPSLQSWFFELPILNVHQQANTFNIRIDKEQGSPSQQHEDEQQTQALQWKLALSFDLEHLGPIYIQVSLLPPTVSSIIWADKKETFSLAQQEISHFKERLKELGLEVGDILCQKGLPPQQATKLSQSLVDIQA
jgi:Flagellar hook-length control protein FliK